MLLTYATRLHCNCLLAPCTMQLLCRAGASSSTAKADSLVAAEPNLTRIMFEAVDARAAGAQAQAGGAGGRTTYQALLAADQAWSNLRNMEVGNCIHELRCNIVLVLL
jgi:hypothetical protein